MYSFSFLHVTQEIMKMNLFSVAMKGVQSYKMMLSSNFHSMYLSLLELSFSRGKFLDIWQGDYN